MAWVLLASAALLTGFVLLSPMLRSKQTTTDTDAELQAARSERDKIEAGVAEGALTPDVAARNREALERRVLEILDRQKGAGNSANRFMAFALAVMLVVGVGMTYFLVGSPDYAYQSSLRGQVEQFERDMLQDPDADAGAWIVLARGQFAIGEYDKSLSSYRQARKMIGDDPRLIFEINSRRQEIARLRGEPEPELIATPFDQATVDAMTQGTDAEVEARIAGMVEGLAARLEEEPGDLEGWLMLIRSRAMLGQIEQAQTDLEMARKAFADQPEALEELQAAAERVGLTAPVPVP